MEKIQDLSKKVFAVSVYVRRFEGTEPTEEDGHTLITTESATKEHAIAFVTHRIAEKCPMSEGWRFLSVLAHEVK